MTAIGASVTSALAVLAEARTVAPVERGDAAQVARLVGEAAQVLGQRCPPLAWDPEGEEAMSWVAAIVDAIARGYYTLHALADTIDALRDPRTPRPERITSTADLGALVLEHRERVAATRRRAESESAPRRLAALAERVREPGTRERADAARARHSDALVASWWGLELPRGAPVLSRSTRGAAQAAMASGDRAGLLALVGPIGVARLRALYRVAGEIRERRTALDRREVAARDLVRHVGQHDRIAWREACRERDAELDAVARERQRVRLAERTEPAQAVAVAEVQP